MGNGQSKSRTRSKKKTFRRRTGAEIRNAEVLLSKAVRPAVTEEGQETERQFAVEYLRWGKNATRAWIALFPTTKWAAACRNGNQTLNRPSVQAMIKDLVRAQMEKSALTAENVLEEIRQCAMQNPLDFGYITNSGEFRLDLRGVPREQMGAVSGFDYDKRGRQVMKKWDKLKAGELLAKYFKLITEKHEIGGMDGVPLVPPNLTIKFRGNDKKKK